VILLRRDNLSYSFDYYPDPNIGSHSHFIILDVYGWDNDNNHYTRNLPLHWLKTDLRNSTSADHVFVFGHEPAYPVGHMKNGSGWWDGSLDRIPEERNRFWTLLEISDVDAYFAGHEHLYSHFNPVPDNPDDPNDSYNPPVDEPNDPNDTLPQGRVHQIITGGAGGDLWRQNTDFHHYVLVNVDGDNITGQARDTNNRIEHKFTFTGNRSEKPAKLIAGNPNSPLWEIEIDRYGHSDCLNYKYTTPGQQDEWVNEMFDWAGYIHYKGRNGEDKKGWLNDPDFFTPTPWGKEEPTPVSQKAHDKVEELRLHLPYIDEAVADVSSTIRNDELQVDIWSGIFSWFNGSKYTLFQDYTFKNITADSGERDTTLLISDTFNI
jgi:hypothetical protein